MIFLLSFLLMFDLPVLHYCHIVLRSLISRLLNGVRLIHTKNNPIKQLSTNFVHIRTMADAKLEAVPLVDIDDSGRFKYILIKVYGKEKADGSEPSKLIVRGYQRAQWHGNF